jgi:hypothetical protein
MEEAEIRRIVVVQGQPRQKVLMKPHLDQHKLHTSYSSYTGSTSSRIRIQAGPGHKCEALFKK